MTADDKNEELGSGNNSQEDGGVPSFDSDNAHRFMETIMRVCLAGFGGALVGLSLSRRPSQATTGRRLPLHVLKTMRDSNLPMTWALATTSFCTMMEISRWTSPMSLLVSDDDSKAIITIGDCTLGGAVAGAAFRGMQVASTKKPPSNIVFGLVSGMMLGCLAGITQSAADWGQVMLIEEEQERQQTDSGVVLEDASSSDETLDAAVPKGETR